MESTPPRIQQLEKATLQDRAYQEIKNALMRGRFSSGEVLTLRALAADLGTSIMPARDALQRLVAEKALTMLPNRSAQVPTTSLEEFEQITSIRVRLEGLAVEMATTNISDDEIDQLEILNKRMQHAIQEQDPIQILESNMGIHFNVYQAAQAPFLLGIIETLWLRIGPLLMVPFRRLALATEMFNEGIDHHQIMINGLRKRNPEVASSALVSDILEAADWYHQNQDVFTK
jgi:DNA-binding GntR family transcriptional regulator